MSKEKETKINREAKLCQTFRKSMTLSSGYSVPVSPAWLLKLRWEDSTSDLLNQIGLKWKLSTYSKKISQQF